MSRSVTHNLDDESTVSWTLVSQPSENDLTGLQAVVNVLERKHVRVTIVGGSHGRVAIVDIDALKLILIICLLHEANIRLGM